MAKKVNSLAFSKAAIEIHDDGSITIIEVTKDGTESFDLVEELREFASDDYSRLVNLTIKEDTVVEGTEE